MTLKPAKAVASFPDNIDWKANPQAYYIDQSPLKPGVARCWSRRAIVRPWSRQPTARARSSHSSSICTGTAPTSFPYWKWPGLFPGPFRMHQMARAGCVKGLHADVPEPVHLNPNEIIPDNLMIEAEMLDSKEFTKRSALGG